MPQLYRSPWETEAALSGLGRQLTNLAIQMPMTRLQMQQMQQEMAYRPLMYDLQSQLNRAHIGAYGAQEKMYGAQAGFDVARTGEIEKLGTARTNFGSKLAAAYRAKMAGGDPTPDLTEAVNFMAQMPQADRAGMMEDFYKSLAIADPRIGNMIATGTKMEPENVALGPNELIARNVPGSMGVTKLDQGGSVFFPQGYTPPPGANVVNSPFGAPGTGVGFPSSLVNLAGRLIESSQGRRSEIFDPTMRNVLDLLEGRTPAAMNAMARQGQPGVAPKLPPSVGQPFRVRTPQGVGTFTPKDVAELQLLNTMLQDGTWTAE